MSSSRKDPAWNYGSLPDPKNSNNVQCNFGSNVYKEGITRLKQHLIGGYRNAIICPKCPEHVKEEIKNFQQKKPEFKEQMNAIPHFDAIAEDEACWEAEQEQNQKRKFSSSGGEGSSAASVQPKKSTQIGPINLFFRKEPTEVTQQRRGKEAYAIDEAKKKLRENAIQKFARWMYAAGLPFNAVNYDSLEPTIEAFGQYGAGIKPPSYYEVRVKYLKKELEHTNNILKPWEADQRLTLNSDDDEENARVFEDDDLTWGDVARAAGVDEDAYAFHPRSSKNITSKASSSKGSSLKAFKATKNASTSSSKSTKNPLCLVDEEEEEVNFDDTDEEDLNCYISNSEREDKNDDNDEDVELGDELESE
ncbi:hypothetical protein Salat_1978700 [Sesamum alatum]|uniref:BED-type domain-containing protein n=1 Tax=Sesamum alatum TaxID=300844 RepID=A0AAE1Y6E7_9LAMI|nr:hypothetical protein Salat_1978700 [Sesamum alatum]